LPMSGINPESIVNNPKKSKMKKFFAIAIITASLAACNNSGDASKTEDTTVVKPDTSAMTTTPDTSSKMSADTSKKMSTDTSKKK